MVEKEATEKDARGGGTPPHTRPQPAADGEIPQTIATPSKIIANAVKVKRGPQDFLEVPEAQLRRVVEELRRVTQRPTQQSQEDAVTRILANTEDIKKKLATVHKAREPRKRGAKSSRASQPKKRSHISTRHDKLFQDAGTSNYQKMFVTPRGGAKAAATLLQATNLLSQFQLGLHIH
jgi:hypothetical protein